MIIITLNASSTRSQICYPKQQKSLIKKKETEMKLKVVVELDTDSGDYSLEQHNLSNPGEGIDYHLLIEALTRIFGDFRSQMGDQIRQGHTELGREDN